MQIPIAGTFSLEMGSLLSLQRARRDVGPTQVADGGSKVLARRPRAKLAGHRPNFIPHKPPGTRGLLKSNTSSTSATM
jgi:hypothetical protein